MRLRRYFYSRNEYNEEFLSLVLEYMPSSLDRILKEQEKKGEALPVSLIQHFMFNFMAALNYLHGKGICHRDIKPHNLLVDPVTGMVKLCDFGCSKRLIEGEPNIQYICARYYRAPEIVFGWAHYSCAIDLWSAGCVMAEMFTLRPLFPGKNSIDQLAKIVKLLGSPTPDDLKAMGQASRKVAATGKEIKPRNLEQAFDGIPVDSLAMDVLNHLLRFDPAKRLLPLATMDHPFFQPVRSRPTGASPALDNTPSVDLVSNKRPSGTQPS